MSKATLTAIWHLIVILATFVSVGLAVAVTWNGHHYAEGTLEMAWAIFLRVLYPEAFGK